MVDYSQKIFTIHFPGKKVYVENTCQSFTDKMQEIKNDRDKLLEMGDLFNKYPNPEIRYGPVTNIQNTWKVKQKVAMEYQNDGYEILNFNLLPPPRLNLFQSIYKWMNS